jgi:ammonia channel protein AmtB
MVLNMCVVFLALASAMMLGPRLGRYDMGNEPLPLGSPVNAVMGLFVLWWGWLAFNSGRYGLNLIHILQHIPHARI